MKVLRISYPRFVAVLMLGVIVAFMSFVPQTLSASKLIGGCPTGDCKGTTELVNCQHILPMCENGWIVHLCEWEENGPGICEEYDSYCWGPGDCDSIKDQECVML